MMFDAFHDEEGMTTVGVVLSLLVTLALVFSAGQAYRVGSASSEVQNVADAAALAAQNEVGEFMIVVRVCDAAVLSLSLTSLVATGLGVAALCTPATASASETLLKAGRDVAYARDRFAEKAADAKASPSPRKASAKAAAALRGANVLPTNLPTDSGADCANSLSRLSTRYDGRGAGKLLRHTGKYGFCPGARAPGHTETAFSPEKTGHPGTARHGHRPLASWAETLIPLRWRVPLRTFHAWAIRTGTYQ